MIENINDTVMVIGTSIVGVLAVHVIKLTYDARKRIRRSSKRPRVRLVKTTADRMVPSTTNTHLVPVYDPDSGDFLGNLLLWNHDNSLVEPVMFHG